MAPHARAVVKSSGQPLLVATGRETVALCVGRGGLSRIPLWSFLDGLGWSPSLIQVGWGQAC